VRFDERFLRPTEVDDLIGDPSRAREVLGWQARTLPPDLARIMVEADLALLDRRGGVADPGVAAALA
jgi:GDPmannose 4,6-dehydratase